MILGNLNRQGNWMVDSFWMFRETGYYHAKCHDINGWYKYYTSQDADYFGIWVDYDNYRIITFAEGDETLVECCNAVQFNKELNDMRRFYHGE